MKNIAIVGGGASGVVCALMLDKKKFNISVFEASDRILKKLLSTGNGRCNMTNVKSCDDILEYSKNYNNPEFVYPSLSSFSPKQAIAFFENIGVEVRQMGDLVYPMSLQANSVVSCLINALETSGACVNVNAAVQKIERGKDGFIINGEKKFDYVILASGSAAGLSLAPLGVNLASLGVKLKPLSPALTPIMTETDKIKGLNGIRAEVRLTLKREDAEVFSSSGELLFKDFGISGIVAFELSSIIARSSGNYSAVIDFMDRYSSGELAARLRERRMRFAVLNVSEFLIGVFAKNVCHALLKAAGLNLNERVGSLSDGDIVGLAEVIKNFELKIIGLRDMHSAQVACGGICADEVDSCTLEFKKLRGLFAVGEALDVDGMCGGYNLQWAWSSAHAAARRLNANG